VAAYYMYFGNGYGSEAGRRSAGVLGDGQAIKAPWRLPPWRSADAVQRELVRSWHAWANNAGLHTRAQRGGAGRVPRLADGLELLD